MRCVDERFTLVKHGSDFVHAPTPFGKLLEQADDAFGDLESVDALDEAEAQKLYKAVTGMKLKMEELQEQLERKVGTA